MNTNPPVVDVLANLRAAKARLRITYDEIAARTDPELKLNDAKISRRLTGQTPLTLEEFFVLADALKSEPVDLIPRRAA